MPTIRELRQAAGLSQFELATVLKVSPSAVYKWERGVTEPRASRLKQMARLFAVSMDDIEFPTGDDLPHQSKRPSEDT